MRLEQSEAQRVTSRLQDIQWQFELLKRQHFDQQRSWWVAFEHSDIREEREALQRRLQSAHRSYQVFERTFYEQRARVREWI